MWKIESGNNTPIEMAIRAKLPLLLRLFLVLCVLLLASLWIASLRKAWHLNHEGILTSLRVVESLGTRYAPKAGTFYRYRLEINNYAFEADMRIELVAGKQYSVLVSPQSNTNFVLAKPSDSLLHVFSQTSGGGFIGWCFVFGLPALILCVSFMLATETRRHGRRR